MLRQITEQLELSLDCVYQLSFTAVAKLKRIPRVYPSVASPIQLLLDFNAKLPFRVVLSRFGKSVISACRSFIKDFI